MLPIQNFCSSQVKVLAQLKHPNIVSYQESFEGKNYLLQAPYVSLHSLVVKAISFSVLRKWQTCVNEHQRRKVKEPGRERQLKGFLVALTLIFAALPLSQMVTYFMQASDFFVSLHTCMSPFSPHLSCLKYVRGPSSVRLGVN